MRTGEVFRDATEDKSAGLNSPDALEQVCAFLHGTLDFYKPSLSLLLLSHATPARRGGEEKEEKVLVVSSPFLYCFTFFCFKTPLTMMPVLVMKHAVT